MATVKEYMSLRYFTKRNEIRQMCRHLSGFFFFYGEVPLRPTKTHNLYYFPDVRKKPAQTSFPFEKGERKACKAVIPAQHNDFYP